MVGNRERFRRLEEMEKPVCGVQNNKRHARGNLQTQNNRQQFIGIKTAGFTYLQLHGIYVTIFYFSSLKYHQIISSPITKWL